MFLLLINCCAKNYVTTARNRASNERRCNFCSFLKLRRANCDAFTQKKINWETVQFRPLRKKILTMRLERICLIEEVRADKA